VVPGYAPYAAIIGGLWQLDEARRDAAKNTGKLIGDELAKAGFGLVVYFSNDESLEPHVVTGYVMRSPSGAHPIHVRYAESQRGQVRFAEEAAHPELFEHSMFPGQDWEAPFYRSLAEEEGIDAVILLGGATSTLIAGQIAIARRLPVLAVDEFGGSAGKIWRQLAQQAPNGNYPSWGAKPIDQLVGRLKDQCIQRVSRRAEVSRRERALATIMSQRYQAVYAAAAFLLLLVTLFFGMVYTPVPSVYPLVSLLGLVFAGATGAVARAVLWDSERRDPLASLLLGSIAGFVVGLAYLIPQWVGAPGVLTPKAEIVSATDKIQFASAVLVAISAGVGFDTVFSRLQKQAEDVNVGVKPSS
jgi:hypothetical protein